jgi:hypothetical protein
MTNESLTETENTETETVEACSSFVAAPGTYGITCLHCEEHRDLHERLW